MKKVGLILSLYAALCPGFAAASGAAPALYGTKEFLIHPVHFANPSISNECGLSSDEFVSLLKTDFLGANIPAVTEAEAKPVAGSQTRVDLVTEIVSINEGLDCRSWVSISAQTDNNLAIPPVDILRNVNVVYWHQGSLINSTQAVHQKSLAAALDKMVTALSKQFYADQRP